MTRACRHMLSWVRGIFSDCSGVSIVEFALILPFILAMFLGIIDYGLTGRNRMEVFEASHSAIQYAAINGWDKEGIEAAAKVNTALPISVSAETYCGCSNNKKIVKQTCNTYCPSSEIAGEYAEVSVSYTNALMFPGAWPTADEYGNIPLGSTAVTRIK